MNDSDYGWPMTLLAVGKTNDSDDKHLLTIMGVSIALLP
jgi:hypothetical protein